MFASLCWIAWNSPIAACRTASARARSRERRRRRPGRSRPPARRCRSGRRRGSPSPRAKPLPSSCSRRSSSTPASTTRSLVVDEFRPSFSSSRVTRDVVGVEDERGDAAGAGDAAGSVRAKRRKVPAWRAVEMKRFVPEIRQPPPPRVAEVRSEPASEPGLGLGQREGADRLAAGQRRDEPRALLLGAEARGSAASPRSCARRRSRRHPHPRARAPPARGCTRRSRRPRRRTPRARTRPSARARPAWGRARAGSGARGPSRPRTARSRPGRTPAPAPGSRAAPA